MSLFEKIFVECKNIENNINKNISDNWQGLCVPPLARLKSIELSRTLFYSLRAEKNAHLHIRIDENNAETLFGVPVHIMADHVVKNDLLECHKEYFRPHF